jgi:FdhD protein
VTPLHSVPLVRLDGTSATYGNAMVAEEVPVALVYNRRPHVVMMTTPADLEDFAIGFSITEQIIAGPADIERIGIERFSRGIEMQLTVGQSVADRLATRTRQLAGRTGCGLCGVEAIDDAVRDVRPVSSTLRIRQDALWRAGAALESRQPLNADTHAVHAAAWADSGGELHLVREDVGRHNALDKVIGALARSSIDPTNGFLIVTSRASVELVQKAAVAGVPLLAAVSRPTGLAIRMAERTGITLVALLRGSSANVYAGAGRIIRS